MGISVEQQMLVEQRVANEAKSTGAAYLLWLFTGAIGGHRFYLGRPGTGVAILALSVFGWITVPVGIGLLPLAIVGIWVLIDAFLIPGMISAHKDKVRAEFTQRALMG